jgi:hypothetical protein
MKNADINLNLKGLKPALKVALGNLRKYSSVLIFLLFMGIYGYMVLRINTLSNPVVQDSEVQAEVKTLPVPRMDESAAKKLESLKDNSVNVKTLFEQGRDNPFTE